jgi:hypothetical protein
MKTYTNRKIATVLFATTFFLSCLILDGLFGAVDVARRFEATQAIWKNQPPVASLDIATNQSLLGVNGTAHYWYGMGQSIYMLPGDIIATSYIKLLGLNDDNLLYSFVVTLITFPIFSAGAIVIAFYLLYELGFSRFVSAAGALSLFFGTTLLHYTQVHQENSQITFLTLCGYYYILLWLKQDKLFFLLLGSALLGSMLLMRVTTLADIVSVGFFAFLALLFTRHQQPQLWRKLFSLVGSFAGSLAFFYFFDRAYQFKRFGSWTNNYQDIFSQQVISGRFNVESIGLVRGQIPSNWPFSMNRLEVIPNIFFSPEKSMFLYDPLLILLIGILLVRGFRMELTQTFPYRTTYLLSGAAMLTLYVAGYSNVTFWSGDWAWALRYFTSPIHILCLLAIPLFIESLPNLHTVWKILFWALTGFAILVQIASISVYLHFELYQGACNGATNFRLVLRFANIFTLLGGREPEINRNCAFLQSFINDPVTYDFTFVPYLPFGFNSPLQFVFITIWGCLIALCLFSQLKLIIGLEKAQQK